MPSKSTAVLTRTITWEYQLLKEVCFHQTTYGRGVRLTCHDDEGGEQFFVTCDRQLVGYLDPYLDLLDRAARGDCDPPCIPVYNAAGRWTFSVTGALSDYPELESIRGRRTLRLRSPRDF